MKVERTPTQAKPSRITGFLPNAVKSAVSYVIGNRKSQDDDPFDENGMRQKMRDENKDDDAMSDTNIEKKVNDDNAFMHNLENTIENLKQEGLGGDLEDMDDNEPLKRDLRAIEPEEGQAKKKSSWT